MAREGCWRAVGDGGRRAWLRVRYGCVPHLPFSLWRLPGLTVWLMFEDGCGATSLDRESKFAVVTAQTEWKTR